MTSLTSVRYPVADLAGELVWATDLASSDTRPAALTCIGCGEPVRLRAGAKNRPHFAHAADTACSGGETALHKTTIRVLREAITSAGANGHPYPVLCTCARCLAQRTADLGRPGCTVTVDQSLEDGIRPDLLVHTASGQRLAVIEVIVTHAPEAAALAVFDRLGLPVICVWPTWETLADMRTGLGDELAKTATRITGCFEVTGSCRFPRHRLDGPVPCPTCQKPARQLSVEVARVECWSCHKQFPMLDFVDCTDDELVLIAASCPEIPNAQELGAARRIRLDTKYSKAAGGSYLMHLCTHCKRIQGDNFLYAHDGATTDTTIPAAAMTLCSNGHLVHREDIPWPTGSVAKRPWVAVGLVGERAHLFDSRPRGGVAVSPVKSANLNRVIRQMVWGGN